MVYPVDTPRPQNLEKLSIEELHQRKHDLKQEDLASKAETC